MPYLAAALLGLLIGSVPFAYLLVRWQRGVDLHTAGSTNVGASNALRTSGSKALGAAVLVLDLLKGVLAVLTGRMLVPPAGLGGALPEAGGPAWWMGAAALLGALLGHNVNPWLSLRARKVVGGKGFATAAGGFGLLTPWLLPVWGLLFLLGRWAFARWRGLHDVIPGNVLATALAPLVGYAVYGLDAFLATAAFALLSLPKHTRQMQALLREEAGR